MGVSSVAHLNHAMMVDHLSGNKPNVTIFTNGLTAEEADLREATKAA